MTLRDLLVKVGAHHADGKERLRSVEVKVSELTASSGKLEGVLDRLRSDLSTYKKSISTLVWNEQFFLPFPFFIVEWMDNPF